MTLLMDFTTLGRTRTAQIASDGLQFVVTHVAYGTDGFNPGTPSLPLALNPAAVSLVAETFRKPIPSAHITIDTMLPFRGQETVYTTVSGEEFTEIIGEAGLIATVTAPGTTGLTIGDEFLLAQAHFGRIVFALYERLAIEWPLDFEAPAMIYAPDLFQIGQAVSITPTIYGAGFAAFVSVGNPLPPSLALNAATGEITGTVDADDLLGGAPAGDWTGIQIQGDGVVTSPPFTIRIIGVTLPDTAVFYSPMFSDPGSGLVYDGTGMHPASGIGAPSDTAGQVGRAVRFLSGPGDMTSTADSADFNIGVNDYTIAGIVQVGTGASAQIVNKHNPIGSNAGISLRAFHNQADFTHGDGSGGFLAGTVPYIGTIDDGFFHSVVWAVERSGTSSLYVDGVLQGTSAVGAQPGSVDNAEPLEQGGVQGGGNSDSIQDETVVFASALDLNQAGTLQWLALRGRTISSWIRALSPAVPSWPALTNLPNGVAASILPTGPSYDPELLIVNYAPIGSLPPGLTMNPATGEITGVPVTNGVYDLRAGASDGMNLTYSPTFRITVS